MRLIDADALLDNLTMGPIHLGYREVEDIEEYVKRMPTIEERKTGRWIHIRDEEDGNALYVCSVCYKGEVHVPIVEVSYCWNCGADMRGEEHG